MANKSVENKLRQAIPILWVNGSGDPKLYFLLSRQRVVMDASSVGQDITDKEAASYLVVADTTDSTVAPFTLGE